MTDTSREPTERKLASLAQLREPFPESEIRFLPRVWCKDCRDMKGVCRNQSHQRVKCPKCKNNMTSAHVDLRYVGHAEATNRLLNVDPTWSWEPVAFDERGLPQYDQNGGLWIRLTVCGVTRLGYGNAEGKRGGDAVKEIIGDAIRNAGMRFGMALDLWTSSDLEGVESAPREEPGRTVAETRQTSPDPDWQAALAEMEAAAASLNFADGLPAQFQATFGHPISQGTADEFREATKLMRESVGA